MTCYLPVDRVTGRRIVLLGLPVARAMPVATVVGVENMGHGLKEEE